MPRDDRDQNFEKALARHLGSSGAVRGNDATEANDCLDAEILAAYHARLLDPEEMALRKAHIASCERCQEILAQLEATDRIAVEADRDLMLDQVILDLPESSAAEPLAPETLASESVPAGASSEPVTESTTELEPAPDPATEPELEIEHEPDLVAASAALPSVELSRAAASSHVPTPVDAASKTAPKTTPSSATITFRPQRSERPKLVRFVALAGALAAGLIFWLVFRDRPNTVDLAQNHAPAKIELPSQSPAAVPPAENNEHKEKDAASDNSSDRGDAASAQAKNSVSPSAMQQLPLQPRSTADNVTNSLDDAKKTIDSAKALQEKSRTGAAAGKPVFTPRDEPSPDNGIYSARAVPQKSSDSARRKLDAVIGTSAVGGLTNASAASGSASAPAAPAANSPSGIPATPPPARTKMIPGVVSDAVTLEAASPALQKSASANQPAFISKDESPSKTANGRVVAALNPLSVPAPSGTTIWRIGQAGMIQRSTNSGVTWSIQPSGIVTDLIAGSAYSDQVCWLVGRNGTILRTTNGGATWQKLASPSNVDLLSIFSINADSATITDAAGRAFETTTAGSHWSRTQLQQ
jgi:hypothetical protein